MKVLQWNVWYREKAENILSLLRETDADVLCLQELTVNHPEYNQGIDEPEFLAKGLGFNYFFAPASDKGTQKFGNAILSRFPILSSKSLFIQDPPESEDASDYSKEGRVYAEISIQVDGKEFSVGTTHMSYVDRFIITPQKEAETNRLLDILRGKKEHFVFSGDLNALPGSYTVNEITKLLRHCGPAFSENTWATKNFSYNDFEASTLDYRLDYCFATPDIEVRSANIVRTDYSDHLPVLVEF